MTEQNSGKSASLTSCWVLIPSTHRSFLFSRTDNIFIGCHTLTRCKQIHFPRDIRERGAIEFEGDPVCVCIRIIGTNLSVYGYVFDTLL